MMALQEILTLLSTERIFSKLLHVFSQTHYSPTRLGAPDISTLSLYRAPRQRIC